MPGTRPVNSLSTAAAVRAVALGCAALDTALLALAPSAVTLACAAVACLLCVGLGLLPDDDAGPDPD